MLQRNHVMNQHMDSTARGFDGLQDTFRQIAVPGVEIVKTPRKMPPQHPRQGRPPGPRQGKPPQIAFCPPDRIRPRPPQPGQDTAAAPGPAPFQSGEETFQPLPVQQYIAQRGTHQTETGRVFLQETAQIRLFDTVHTRRDPACPPQ
jgi:hypothetical protein